MYFINRNKLHILVSNAMPFHLPICEINPNRNLLSTLHNFMKVNLYFKYILYIILI